MAFSLEDLHRPCWLLPIKLPNPGKDDTLMIGPEDSLRSMFDFLFDMDTSANGSLAKTPNRVWRMWKEFFVPYNPQDDLTLFDSPANDLVVQTKIPVRSLCEHHFLPFFGHCAIGYVPGGKVIGLSKLARIVKGIGTRRPTIQENYTNEVAQALYASPLHPKGVIVVMSAEHTCMTVRGVQAPGVQTKTSALRGIFEDDKALRREFFAVLSARPDLG